MVRNWDVSFRTTKSEKEELKVLAHGAGFITMSEYVRHCCYERPFWVHGKIVEMNDTLEEIKKLLQKRKRKRVK